MRAIGNGQVDERGDVESSGAESQMMGTGMVLFITRLASARD